MPDANRLMIGKEFRIPQFLLYILISLISAYSTPGQAAPPTPLGTTPGSTTGPGPQLQGPDILLAYVSAGAERYEVAVRDVDTGSFVVDDNTSQRTYLARLTAGGSYRWNVRACDSTGCSNYTTPKYFYIAGQALPPTPTNTTPGSTVGPGPTFSDTSITLSWSSSSGAAYYDFGVTDLSTGSLVWDQQTTGTGYTVSLSPGKPYRWNVRACNSSNQCSSFTSRRYFQISGLPSAIPDTPSYPRPGATTAPGFWPDPASSDVTLSWVASNEATSYSIEVLGVSTNSLASYTTALDSYYLPNLNENQSYNWRVSACNELGCSAFTAPLYFLVPPSSSAVPMAPVNPTPGSASSPGPIVSDCAGVQNEYVNLNWNDSTETTYYSIDFFDAITNTPLTEDYRVTYGFYSGPTKLAVAGLSVDGRYSWRVAACNTTGCSSRTSLLYFQCGGVVNDDADGDGIPDSSDNCPDMSNADQADLDDDGIGDVCDADADGDELPNEWEVENGLDPYDPTDASEDFDGDRLTNLDEYQQGTEPRNDDTDGDGITDGNEIEWGTDPRDEQSAVAPPAEPPSETETLVDGSVVRSLPTVVLTHGLSYIRDEAGLPNSIWTGRKPRQGMGLISAATGAAVNVVQYNWLGAFQVPSFPPFPAKESYNAAQGEVIPAGSKLASALIDLLGSDYSQPIHFIGHSLGTAVTAYAAKEFLETASEISRAQITILDRPDHIYSADSIPGCDAIIGVDCENYPADFYAVMFEELQTDPDRRLNLLIDNYHSPSSNGWGVGDDTNGRNVYNHPGLINPNILNDLFDPDDYANNHSGVHQWYRWTVDASNSECTSDGPWPDAPQGAGSSLNPCMVGWAWSIANPNRTLEFPPTQNLGTETNYQALPIGSFTSHGCITVTGTGPLEGKIAIYCEEASSPFAVIGIAIPEGAEWFDFKYLITNPGDGDYAAVYFDDTLIWKMSLAQGTNNLWKSSGPIPIGGLSESRRLTIALYGVNDSNAEFYIGDGRIGITELDMDWDDDGVSNDQDNCPVDANLNQSNIDGDAFGDACDSDVDGDGVENVTDLCAGTPISELVDTEIGCSISQLCPCEGPRGTTEKWRNHGKHVSCISKTVNTFVDSGLISQAERGGVVSDAARSSCGKST